VFGEIGGDVREDGEDSSDPLASFFATEDSAGSWDQIVKDLLPLQNYLILGDNDVTIAHAIDNNIDTTNDSNIEITRDTAIQEDFLYPIEPFAAGTNLDLVSLNGVLYPISEIPQLTQELLPGEPSPSPATTTTTSSPPPTPTQPSVPPALSTRKTRRSGSKRKAREPDSPDNSSQAPAKRSKATEWRKEQDREIEENDQLLRNYEAEVKEKEMFILIHQAILAGHRHMKTFDYASKMASFVEQKKDIEYWRQKKLWEIGKTQKKAEYKKAQVTLLESYQAYISTSLTEEILAINKSINTCFNTTDPTLILS